MATNWALWRRRQEGQEFGSALATQQVQGYLELRVTPSKNNNGNISDCQCLLSICSEPGSMLYTLPALSHFVLASIPWYFYPHSLEKPKFKDSSKAIVSSSVCPRAVLSCTRSRVLHRHPFKGDFLSWSWERHGIASDSTSLLDGSDILRQTLSKDMGLEQPFSKSSRLCLSPRKKKYSINLVMLWGKSHSCTEPCGTRGAPPPSHSVFQAGSGLFVAPLAFTGSAQLSAVFDYGLPS